jgi:hypothetical protein
MPLTCTFSADPTFTTAARPACDETFSECIQAKRAVVSGHLPPLS